MLECIECKHQINYTYGLYPNKALVVCKEIKSTYLDFSRKSMSLSGAIKIDDRDRCLFFKPHCGKCGGGCGRA